MRLQQVFVREAEALRSEHHGGGAAPAVRLGDDAAGGLPRIDHAEVLLARARGGGEHQPAVGNRLPERCHHACPLEHVVGAGGAGRGLRVRKLARIHEHEFGEAHVLHGARHRPDVAGM